MLTLFIDKAREISNSNRLDALAYERCYYNSRARFKGGGGST